MLLGVGPAYQFILKHLFRLKLWDEETRTLVGFDAVRNGEASVQ